GIEYAGRASDDRVFDAGYLGDRAFRRKIAFQDRQVALGIDRMLPWPDDILIGPGLGRNIPESFRDRLPADSQAVAMQQVMVEQHFHDLRNAARLVQISCDIAARWFQVAQYRYTRTNRFEIIDTEIDFCRMGNGQQM